MRLLSGKWFNYGVIFLVMILDLNMWKNQIFYQPYEYGQYVGPGKQILNVEKGETLRKFNRSTLTYEWRAKNVDPSTNRPYVEQDLSLNSRYIGASIQIKCLAFIPSVLAFLSFGFFFWLLGRFPDPEPFAENLDTSYERMTRKSPSESGKEMGATPEEPRDTGASDSPKRSGTPVSLFLDRVHFAKTPSASDAISAEAREEHPVADIDPETPPEDWDVSHDMPFLLWLGISHKAAEPWDETNVSHDVARQSP